MDDNKIKNVKLNLEISQNAACAILDSLVRTAAITPSAHDNNTLIDYINKQVLLDNYPEGNFGEVIALHMSKLQASYDCCAVALELYEALEDSRYRKADEKPAPENKLPEVGTQVSNEKPAPESKLPKGSIKVVFKIYTLTCYQSDAETSIIWDVNMGGYARYTTSRGICNFHTRQDLLDYIIRVLTPEQSLKEYAESNEYTVEKKELVLSVTRKLLADLGAPPREDYSGELRWECVNS